MSKVNYTPAEVAQVALNALHSEITNHGFNNHLVFDKLIALLNTNIVGLMDVESKDRIHV